MAPGIEGWGICAHLRYLEVNGSSDFSVMALFKMLWGNFTNVKKLLFMSQLPE